MAEKKKSPSIIETWRGLSTKGKIVAVIAVVAVWIMLGIVFQDDTANDNVTNKKEPVQKPSVKEEKWQNYYIIEKKTVDTIPLGGGSKADFRLVLRERINKRDYTPLLKEVFKKQIEGTDAKMMFIYLYSPEDRGKANRKHVAAITWNYIHQQHPVILIREKDEPLSKAYNKDVYVYKDSQATDIVLKTRKR